MSWPSATPWSPPPSSGRTSPSALSGSSDPRLQPRSLGSPDVTLSSGSCAPQTLKAKNISKLPTHLDNCLHLTSSFRHCHPWQTCHKSKALPLQLFTSKFLESASKTHNRNTPVMAVDHKKPANSGPNATKEMPEEQVEGKSSKFGHWICMIPLVVLQVYTIAVLYSFILLILFGSWKH